MFFTSTLTTFSLMNVVLAQLPKDWTPGTAGSGACRTTDDVATIQGLECVFFNVVSVVTMLVGLAVFVMLVIGGFKYLTSGGDPKAQEQAKNTMTYAVLGMVLIIAAYLILKFISLFTGVTGLETFTIPFK
ncbi:MAG: pilin [Candidatus Gottesmanbacteria bacterium]